MVEILCTIAGAVAGIAIVASLMQARGDRSRWHAVKTADDELRQPSQMRGIADQLRLLTFRVAADVSAHNEKVEAINGRLQEPQAEQPEHMLAAINDLKAANEYMQNQLAEARKRIADQTEMIEEASLQARTDALTGLANRRALNEFLQNCINALRPDECAGLLLLDIDEFKTFNDTYGHTTGDAVLAAFARNLKKFCNQECYPARHEGGEFAVVLTGRDINSVAMKSATLRKLVSEQSICFEAARLKITASAGLSMLVPGDTLQTAFDRSDEGVFRAKKAGRDQGFWLNGAHWQPLPTADISQMRERAPDAQTLIRQSVSALARQPDKSRVESSEAPQVAQQSQGTTEDVASNNHTPEGRKKSLSDVLDLPSFMTRTTVYFDQLRRAELPATGMLVEAQWSLKMDPTQSKECWATVLAMIQSQLRGIDVVCIYRPNTVCVFLPGCSIEAATERASRIQLLLETNREDWQPREQCPDRLSISIAQALENEDTAQFLRRLDQALSEAEEGGRFELAIHDGQGTRLESTVQT